MSTPPRKRSRPKRQIANASPPEETEPEPKQAKDDPGGPGKDDAPEAGLQPTVLPPMLVPEQETAAEATWGAFRLSAATLQADLADAFRAATQLAADPKALHRERLEARMQQVQSSYGNLLNRIEFLREQNKPNI